MSSIRRRLLVWLLPPITLAALFVDAITFVKARAELVDMLDMELERVALAVADAPDRAEAPQRGRVVQITDAATRDTSPAAGPPVARQPGPATVHWQGADWRTYAVVRDDRVVQVAEPLSERRRHANAVALGVIVPFSVAVVPLFALLVWFGVGRGLAPLHALAQALERRRPGSLDPVSEAGLPREVAPVARALNELLAQLADHVGKERRFIADAAHGLRTPLAAVQLQIENLERASSPAEREAAFDRLKAGVHRATNLVAQMLTTARLNGRDERLREPARVDLDAIVKRVLVENQPLAENRGIDLGLVGGTSITVKGDAENLRILLSNLVDNALRYTAPGGIVDVLLRRDGDSATIEVVDDGPGIAPEERERVFDRFYRCERDGVPGSGLGLAIVAQVVAQHRGRVTLGEGAHGRGLRVTVCLPGGMDADFAPPAAGETSEGGLHAAT